MFRTSILSLSLCALLLAAAPGRAIAEPAPKTAQEPALLELNSATLEQLVALPGIGPRTAEEILSLRAARGAFTSLRELLDVPGIGEKRLEAIAPHLTVSKPATVAVPAPLSR